MTYNLSSQPKVTATMPSDTTAPSAPVLISPANNSTHTVNLLTFVWEKSTDNRQMDHYDFYLDGVAKFTTIPLSAVENGDYKLAYDSGTGRYSLTVKAAIADGSHTWKVRAVDYFSNYADSSTWNFTIDTQAPSFVLSQIGDQTVSISAQDPGTIPSSPLELNDNEPLLVATGEASATVQTTVVIPGDPTQNYSSAISSGGAWSLQLGVFERNVIITLNFIITDTAGNINTLSGVQFLIKAIVIPSSPTPSPSPSPGVSPEVSPSPSPFITILPITITPPREAIVNFTQELVEILPPAVQEIIVAIADVAQTVAPVSVAIVVTALPIASSVAVASQFGGGLSPELILKILQALGLIPVGKPQGMVFDSDSYEPVPFALLTITSQDREQPLIETVVTDVYGVYKGVKLHPGIYQLIASHQDYLFPTKKDRPSYLGIPDFYRGEKFKAGSEKQNQLFLIPVDAKEKSKKKSWKTHLRIFLSRLSRLSSDLIPLFFFVSIILTIVFPSFWNYLTLAIYTLIMANKIRSWVRVPLIKGVVTDQEGTPLPNAIVRISLPESNELIAVLSTDQKGRFAAFINKGIYQISTNLNGYIWYEEDAAMSFYQVDASTNRQSLNIALTSVAKLTQNLF